MIDLLCPRCGNPLGEDTTGHACTGCGSAYPAVDGIPVLTVREEHYMGELGEEEMNELLAEMDKRGFPEVALDTLKTKNPFVYDYACNPTRADFRFLLPAGPGIVVLDHGAGLGGVTRGLARQAGTVVSTDTVVSRLRFARHLCRAVGIDNVTFICSGDSARLPFERGTFDAAVLNGVLEWVPVTIPDTRPAVAQAALLAEMSRCLKPGGVLYTGIENRFGYNYFLGALDHNGLRFTSLLPRSAAGAVSRIAGKGPYRTLTHTRRGYRELLEDAGFSDITFYWTYPNYRHLQAIVPLERETILFFLNTYLNTRSLKHRLLRTAASLSLKFGCFSFFTPSYGITAVKR